MRSEASHEFSILVSNLPFKNYDVPAYAGLGKVSFLTFMAGARQPFHWPILEKKHEFTCQSDA